MPGNYFDTPLETLLPVEMELKDKNNIPDMGLMIVTDRSEVWRKLLMAFQS